SRSCSQTLNPDHPTQGPPGAVPWLAGSGDDAAPQGCCALELYDVSIGLFWVPLIAIRVLARRLIRLERRAQASDLLPGPRSMPRSSGSAARDITCYESGSS